MSDASKGWRADCFRTSMANFDAAYAKARGSSQPDDWMEAALAAQQFRNVAYAVLTGEAPKQLRPLPFNMDQRAQAAVLADLPPSVAQEAGEFYENADAGRPRGTMLKREAMAVAWQSVLRPYLIGLRDQYDAQRRPDGESAALKKALQEIANGTCLVPDDSDDSDGHEIEVWMDAEDLQEIARKALGDCS